MNTCDGIQRQLQSKKKLNAGTCTDLTVCLKAVSKGLLLVFLCILNLKSPCVWAQDTQEKQPILKVLPSIQFSTELEAEDGSSTPAFFNLLSFAGQKDQWQDAQVEIKLPIQEVDLVLAKYLKQLSSSNTVQASEATSLRSMLPKIDYHVVGQLEAVNSVDPPIWVIWIPQETKHIAKSDFAALEQILNVLRDYAEPESIIYIYQGQLMPKSSGISFRAANFNLDKLKNFKIITKLDQSRRVFFK